MAGSIRNIGYMMCYGIVKGKMPKSVWAVNAKDYESAIRSFKRSAQSNQRDMFSQATLFHNGSVAGWSFYTEGKQVYVSKSAMQSIGLIPKSRN